MRWLNLLSRRLAPASKMTNIFPPKEPLVVIFGSTGTGKSELAVELATRFKGEIVNADAMQLYRGLPVITNKMSVEDRQGIPHYLLGTIGLNEEAWTTGMYKNEATKAITEIRQRGRLPIVVGGTHYYINGLLFEESLVTDPADIQPAGSSGVVHQILNASVEEMLEKLREVDPAMADKWHPNDSRKIRRSLEIYLTTGKRASDIYAEQQKRKRSKWTSSERDSPWQALLFWIYSKPDALNARLDNRVDKMLDRGLLDETSEMFQYLHSRTAQGEEVDRSKGIWQSIGFKEFEPYLQAAQNGADAKLLNPLKSAGTEQTQGATRRYAKYQVKWIKTKTVPLLKDEHMLDRLYLLDSTAVDKFHENVASKAVSLTEQFLAGKSMPLPNGVSETANEVLASALEAKELQEKPSRRVCDICNATLLTEAAWQRHIDGKGHKRNVRHKKRTALVPAQQAANVEETTDDIRQEINSA